MLIERDASPAADLFRFIPQTDAEASGLAGLPEGPLRLTKSNGLILLSCRSMVRRVSEVLESLAPQEVHLDHLSTSLGISKARVSTALTILKENGLVERWHRGCWRWKGRR